MGCMGIGIPETREEFEEMMNAAAREMRDDAVFRYTLWWLKQCEEAEVETARLAALEKAVIDAAQAWVDDREALANFHARVGWRDTCAELAEAVTALRQERRGK